MPGQQARHVDPMLLLAHRLRRWPDVTFCLYQHNNVLRWLGRLGHFSQS